MFSLEKIFISLGVMDFYFLAVGALNRDSGGMIEPRTC